MGAFNSTIVTVSAKGWVVIPSLFRRKIGLKPGMKMEVTETEGKIVLTPQVGDPVDEPRYILDSYALLAYFQDEGHPLAKTLKIKT